MIEIVIIATTFCAGWVFGFTTAAWSAAQTDMKERRGKYEDTWER